MGRAAGLGRGGGAPSQKTSWRPRWWPACARWRPAAPSARRAQSQSTRSVSSSAPSCSSARRRPPAPGARAPAAVRGHAPLSPRLASEAPAPVRQCVCGGVRCEGLRAATARKRRAHRGGVVVRHRHCGARGWRRQRKPMVVLSASDLHACPRLLLHHHLAGVHLPPRLDGCTRGGRVAGRSL